MGKGRRAPAIDRDAARDEDPLDPLFRQRDLLAPAHAAPVASPPPLAQPPVETTSAPVHARARASLEDVLTALVRRIAWSGDGRRGAVRLELGAGALAGATLLVEADEGRVRVRLSAPPGVDAEAWRRRIAERFAAKRIAVDAVEVE